MDEFKALFNPDSVAVIGASPDFKRLGYHCLRSLLMSGFPGEIYPVHPKLAEILSLKAYPSVISVPAKIDLAIVAVRTPIVRSVLQECIEKGIKGIVLITAGFKEISDRQGAELQEEIATIATRSNVKIIGPNTFGIVNLHARLNASFTPEFSLTPKGHISLVSQSGGFCHLIAPLAMAEDIGMSKIIGIGNRCNTEFADILEYLARDKDTAIIMMYLEGVDDARNLFDVAAKVNKLKPVLALKAGKFTRKDTAAFSHTGSMAGDNEIYMNALKQAGIISVEDSMELLDVAKTLLLCPIPRGRAVAILSGQAGPGIIMSDICEQSGLVLPFFSPDTVSKVNELIPAATMKDNPIDMGPAWYDWETTRKVIEVVLDDKSIDSLLLYFAYASANKPLLDEISGLLTSRCREKPIICCFPAPTDIWIKEKEHLKESGIALFPTPERASKALRGLAQRARQKEINNVTT
jgi:acetyl-CoA synthetase (ADP-forming)